MSTDRQIFDLEGAARYLGVGLNTMGDLIKHGKVRHVHIGRLIRVHKVALDEYVLNSHTHDPAQVLAQHGIAVPDGLQITRRTSTSRR